MRWLRLQHHKAEDWVISTGKTTSIRDFVKIAFSMIGVELEFVGSGLNEKGIVKSCSNKKYNLEVGNEVVAVSEKYFRPTEVDLLIGDSTKAKEILGWEPETSLKELIYEMVESDLKLFNKDKYLRQGGFETFNHYE